MYWIFYVRIHANRLIGAGAGFSRRVFTIYTCIYHGLGCLGIHAFKSSVNVHRGAPYKFMGEVVDYSEDKTMDDGYGKLRTRRRETGKDTGGQKNEKEGGVEANENIHYILDEYFMYASKSEG